MALYNYGWWSILLDNEHGPTRDGKELGVKEADGEAAGTVVDGIEVEWRWGAGRRQHKTKRDHHALSWATPSCISLSTWSSKFVSDVPYWCVSMYIKKKEYGTNLNTICNVLKLCRACRTVSGTTSIRHGTARYGSYNIKESYRAVPCRRLGNSGTT